ncbi:O-fucosyltransferase family protein [Raphanus sativus]|nr:O-fucosyltransferase family protein [Raphanus sativus]
MVSQAERDPSTIQIRLPGSSHSSLSPPPSPSLLRSKPSAPPRVEPSLTGSLRSSYRSYPASSGNLLFAPLVYISCMLFRMRTASFDAGDPTIIHRRPAPDPSTEARRFTLSSAPRLTPIMPRLMRYQRFGNVPIKASNGSHALTSQSNGVLPDSNGFIFIEANGGLNQQRTSICNAVAVAGYLNATLVIPNFHYHSIWKDPSKFGDIYDEEYFISTLANDVRVVDTVPEYLMERFGFNLTKVYNFRVKAWAPTSYYRDSVLPKLLEEKVIRISPFANRLSFDAPRAIQRFRCLANNVALRFAKPILTQGETLVKKMKKLSANNTGKYVSVHLRFEEDMVAFSCCVFDGGNQEKQDMIAARERGWKGKFTKPGRVIRPGANRLNGKCPLTPLEVGLILRGMGFNKSTYIYLASGPIYGGNRTMAPLLEMFPNLQTKEMLASEEELAPFKSFSSRMAALDYTVCLHSEVFVTTQGGNFPHFLMGHRRYLFGGHSKTIRPDKRKLAVLFDNPKLSWRSFKHQMLNMRSHSDSKGFELKRSSDSIYIFPCPDCMCRRNKTTATT